MDGRVDRQRFQVESKHKNAGCCWKQSYPEKTGLAGSSLKKMDRFDNIYPKNAGMCVFPLDR